MHTILQVLPPVENKERWFLEIRNRAKWVLQVGGREMLLFKRKWFGKRCPNWDRVRNQHPMLEECEICFGTGFEGGFFRPIPILVSIASPVDQQIVIEEQGMRRIFRPRNWTLWEPRLVNKDLLFDYERRLFWVVRVQETRWKRFIIRQVFDLEEVEPSHVLYRSLDRFLS